MKKPKVVRRVRLIPSRKFKCCFDEGNRRNIRPPKDWDLGYELVVSFHYGLDDDQISKVAGLRYYDTGTMMSGPEAGTRDLMFPCGTDKELALLAARRLFAADHFGALRIRISCPVEHIGKDSFTPWIDAQGKLIEKTKHRKKALKIIKRGKVA